MKFRSKNLLVTGGAGFIGSNFIEYLLNKYKTINIYNLDILTYAGSLKNTQSFESNTRYKFIKGNICDKVLLNKIFKKYKIDGVINFAAESHVDNSIKNPEIFIETNIKGTFALLNTCYKNWMSTNFKYLEDYKESRFHQISTDEVYGSIEAGSFNENDTCKPNSPYSASKASADMLVRSFSKTFGLNTIISRSSNNYGPRQHNEKFIPSIINSINSNLPINVYGDGKNIRDWIYVMDHAEAIDIIFNYGKYCNIYNIAGKNEMSNLELIDLIFSLHKDSPKKSINFIKDRFGHDRRYSVDISKIKDEFCWEPKAKIKRYLKKIINN